MRFSARRCTWHFHWWPMVYVNFGGHGGVLMDWLGFTVEVGFSK